MTMLQRTMIVLALGLSFGAPAWAQGYGYSGETGWGFGMELIYQDSKDLSFEGGSSASVDDDLAFTFTFGYRFNPKMELEFAIDWASVDYDATLQSALLPNVSIDVTGEYEYFTPRINLNYYFSDKPVSPYIRAGIGWAFIDTNIPNSRVQVGCWWHPWYGQICTPFQSTKDVDEFAYQLGVGVRWKLSKYYALRLGYEKQWIDFGNATSTPDFDQIRLGFIYLY
jgi:opacity protein-like surface antigen